MNEEDRERRLAAKGINERLKLLSSFFSNGGLALIGGGVAVPWITQRAAHPLWFLAGLCLHIAGQVVLLFLQSEE